MRRLLIVGSMVLAALALFASPVMASATHNAGFDGWDFDFPPEGSVWVGSNVDVVCPAGQTFLGRVSLRSNGQTVGVGKIKGTCNPSGVLAETFSERASLVPCGDPIDMGGQIRSSDGVKFTITKLHFVSCH